MYIISELVRDHPLCAELYAVLKAQLSHQTCVETALGVVAMYGDVCKPADFLVPRPTVHSEHGIFNVYLEEIHNQPKHEREGRNPLR